MIKKKYKYNFYKNIKNYSLKKGINEEIIKKISFNRKEPKWMLNFRLESYNIWKNMKEPNWLNGNYPKIDYQKYVYYTRAINKKIVKYEFKKLGIPTKEKNNIAIDAIFDSTSIYTTYKEKLKKNGILFCSFNESVNKYPNLIKKYLGTVVSNKDNFFASLNSAVFSDGTFVYIPKNIKCPIDLSTYFRINSKITNQFERTLIILNDNSYLSYIEGCTAKKNNIHQLHAAVVEIIVKKKSEIKYSTIQNWYKGNKKGEGILNFVTKRSLCEGNKSKTSWIQAETGSSITWKYPSVILKGNNSIGEFFSVSITSNYQQTDTGTKMIHIGKNTKSTIISKSVSLDNSKNTYRGLVNILDKSKNSRNYTQCDSMIIGKNSSANTFPDIKVNNNSSKIEHEASISKIGEDQIFYLNQRGFTLDDSISIIVNGFCKSIFNKLPLEFSIESQKLLSIVLTKKIG